MMSFDANSLAGEFSRLTTRWHTSDDTRAGADEFPRLAAALHKANFDLWHQEDAARSTGGDAAIAAAKRAIDALNQQRNDFVEKIDRYLLAQLATENLPAADAALHTETPGMVMDRLSILALKMFHTEEEIARTDAPAGHAERNRERLAVLTAQRDDMAQALEKLWDDVLHGRRRFKLYRQMKMYNDPTLNPVLYAGKSDDKKL
jgi:hypothetical protein